MGQIYYYILMMPAILIATTLHEFVRAAVSTSLGDKNPKQSGRLTLNPFKHFEPVGFLLMFATGGFGWGKPVETSALYYKNRKRDTLLTACLPTLSNLILAILSASILKHFVPENNVVLEAFFQFLMQYNVALAVYNIVPITPMDGLKVLSSIIPANSYFKYLQYEKVAQMGFLLLLFMGYTSIIFSPIIFAVTRLVAMLAF